MIQKKFFLLNLICFLSFNLSSSVAMYNSFDVIFYSNDYVYWQLLYKNKTLLFMYKKAYETAKIIIDDARKNNLQVTILNNTVTSIENKHEVKNYLQKTEQTNKNQQYVYVAAENIKFKNGFLWFKSCLRYQVCGKNKWNTLKLPNHPKTQFIKSIITNNQKEKKILAINITALTNDFIFHYIHPQYIISELTFSNITSSCEAYYD